MNDDGEATLVDLESVVTPKFETTIHVRIPIRTRIALRRLAAAQQLKETDIVRAALRAYVNAKEETLELEVA